MNMKSIVTYLVLIVFVATPLRSSATGTDPSQLCLNESYVVGFFNGVWNTELDAVASTAVIEHKLGTQFNGEKIAYETFYNNTGSDDWFLGGAQDVAEVFMQKADEIEPDFGKHFEVFWSTVSGDSDGFFKKVRNVVGSGDQLVIGLLDELYSTVVTIQVGEISSQLSSPPTLEDYKKHSARITNLANEGNMLLLVAHSQGNLFVNNAYDSLADMEGFSADNMGLVHIAPASSVINGPHILADQDLVINGLRALGENSVPPITTDIPLSHLSVDLSGHTLVNTYLYDGLSTNVQVLSALGSELDRLQPPLTEATQGAFSASLIWNGSGDVDLHAFEPSGTHVYYDNDVGDVGFLDTDNTTADGPEHYFASCDSNILQPGTYLFGFNNFAAGMADSATLQISTPYIANLITKSFDLGAPEGSAGDSSPEVIVSVSVFVNGEGNFIITAD